MREARPKVGKLYAARNGILGALHEQLLDTDAATADAVTALGQRPGSAFGTRARYKLARFEDDEREYRRLIDVFRAHDIGMVFFNGGNDSMDTALKLSQLGRRMDYPLTCIGLPKTVDNDLPVTDCCPASASAAKYVAVSPAEAALDVAGMARTSTRVFILEVMGRHAGWIAAAAAWRARVPAKRHTSSFSPRCPSRRNASWAGCARVRGAARVLRHRGQRRHALRRWPVPFRGGRYRCLRTRTTRRPGPGAGEHGPRSLGYKHHYAISDYLQRSARHLASATDWSHAYAAGRAGVELAIEGGNAVMITIQRTGDDPYAWETSAAPLEQVANREKELPRNFITPDGYGITPPARTYLQPLIEGEALPPFRNGMPVYEEIDLPAAERRLPSFA